MDIKTAAQLCKVMPANQSVLFIGKHGIGKSQLVRQLARHFHAELVKKDLINPNIPISDVASKDGNAKVDCYMIDRRLSQMSEGDMIGLPELVDGVTRFCPPEWYMKACKEPRIILLDEFNRATIEVIQAGFQVVLDFELNGYRLHPETRVYAAINPDTGSYIVNSMDAALLDRFAVIELEPTAADWFDWASDKEGGNILPQIRSFLKENRDFMDPPENAQPGGIFQSRRSWEMLDHSMRYANLEDCVGDEGKNPMLFAMALARVGVEAATAFVKYSQNMARNVSADEILNKWSKKLETAVDKLGVEKHNIIIEKLGEHCKDNVWTARQVNNLAKYAMTLPGEHVINFWNKVAESGVIDNATAIHKKLGRVLLEHLTAHHEEELAKTKDENKK